MLEFQLRRLSHQPLGPVRVTHARKLHEQSVFTEYLYVGLADSRRVDTVVYGALERLHLTGLGYDRKFRLPVHSLVDKVGASLQIEAEPQTQQGVVTTLEAAY